MTSTPTQKEAKEVQVGGLWASVLFSLLTTTLPGLEDVVLLSCKTMQNQNSRDEAGELSRKEDAEKGCTIPHL